MIDQPGIDQSERARLRSYVAALRTPRGLLLVALIAVWLALSTWTFRQPFTETGTRYDFAASHLAGRLIITGGDPYTPDYAAAINGDSSRSAYPYPPAAVWVLLPFLPWPTPLAAALWVNVSLLGLLALPLLLGLRGPRWFVLVPLLYYPSLYALLLGQWAPMQMLLLALSLWLTRRGRPLLGGLLLPLAAIKPTTGLGLLLVALILCWRDRRWWQGLILGGLLWYGLPLLLQPDWPLRWFESLRRYADPGDRQYLLTLTDLPDGKLLAAATAACAIWQGWRRNWVGLACAALVLSMLVTPHRAQYDYPLLCLPLLYLPPRHRWLAIAAVALSWGLPLTFTLGWRSSLQLTLLLAALPVLACWLAGPEPQAGPTAPPERAAASPTAA